MTGPIPERYQGLDRFVARKLRGPGDRGSRPAARDRGPGHRPALRRPLRRCHRALPHRPVVRRRQDPGDPGHRRCGRTAAQCSSRRTGRRPISSGCGNIQPWCISRQLWWGHRIPAWYGPDGHIFVGMDEADAAEQARAHYGETTPLRQDDDVLDTWFSSALWPFSTLGWPDETEDLRAVLPHEHPGHRLRHHLLLGRKDDDDGPALHGKGALRPRLHQRPDPRTRRGPRCPSPRAMSWTPLELVDEFGADALRFTLVAMSGQARDIKLAKPRIEGYRNLGTKLWNAARFCEMNGAARVEGFDPAAVTLTVNRWSARGDGSRRPGRHQGAGNLRLRRGGGRPSTASSGTCSATGSWSSPSRFCWAPTLLKNPRRQRPRPAPRRPGCWKPRSGSSTPSRPSSPRPCGRRRRTATAC